MKWNLEQLGAIHNLINDEHWSGTRLASESRRRAKQLEHYFGLGKHRYIIAHGNSPSFFADLFAVWQAGGCAVCVNPELTASELATLVSFVDATAVLSNQEQSLVADVPVLYLDQDDSISSPGSVYDLQGNCQLDDPALILFSSDTTGEPKGVVHSHRSLQARIALNLSELETDTLSRSLCLLPSHLGHGLIGNCLTPLMAGGELFLFHGAGEPGAAKLGAVIDHHQIRFMSSVPSFWKVALNLSPPPQGGSLRRLHIGSAPLSADLWQEVIHWSGTDQVANVYGITETANWIGGALASDYAPEDGLLGKVWGGSVAILDQHGVVRNEGEGEILLQAPSLMQGYFQRDDLTREVLKDGWYHTGDTGTLDRQGILRMTGRTKDAINYGGIKIYPEELDLLLERHPQVEEACTFAQADGSRGHVVAVAIKLGDLVLPQPFEPRELDKWLSPKIRKEARPDKIFILDEIPKTDRGKLNRDTVAAYCLAQQRLQEKSRQRMPKSQPLSS